MTDLWAEQERGGKLRGLDDARRAWERKPETSRDRIVRGRVAPPTVRLKLTACQACFSQELRICPEPGFCRCDVCHAIYRLLSDGSMVRVPCIRDWDA